MSEMIIKADAEDAYQTGYKEGFHAGYRQAMSEMPEIVHCKDCKFCEECMEKAMLEPDWFCADGKRKEG